MTATDDTRRPMKLAALKAPFTFELLDEPVPAVAPDEVLVRVEVCGVCTSELDAWQGRGDTPLPYFPGHEVSGVVEELGTEVTSVSVGDPVAVWVTERGFAEYVAVKAEHCFPAGGVPLDLALAEPLACAVNAVELADVCLGDDVVLIGAGFMGHLVQQLVMLRGVRHVIVADTRPDVLERALRLGATHVVDVGVESLPAVVADITDGAGADVSFEITGAQGPLGVLGDVTRMSGKIALVGFHQGENRQLPLGQWNWKAFTLVNAHFREVPTILRGMSVGMRLLRSRRLSLDGLVTHRVELADIGDAFGLAQDKPAGFVKAVVTCSR
ncbi:alcohol dehydrogenase catalytic domain-containing protein [Phytoactinopolyspora alkaliphila]|uniref:Alcohol dehydrogenase catalytic domain-containing protein n=1 Tax=Phytoactinopolyspora alkaliphila TaxID=1783498 RepID=A0A6N9YLZ7_9ACTN|nr:alcohol dehydrogenase catalytic domain-containing protein [Phytoactinopolyspora alkaliphila]NED95878.1 alcohol dehydrogenase catalytic domain-containing protein [Phytoactinopolyspora alkaliphila]